MHTEAMREKLFTVRMTDEERERAERVSKHYGLNVAGLIRMLLKREDEALVPRAGTPEDDFRWTDTHDHILGILADDKKAEPMPLEEISRCLNEGDNRGSAHYDHSAFKVEVPRALNALVRNEYMKRFKSGYTLTAKGKARVEK